MRGVSFDPQSADPATLPRLLWVRCADVMQAVKAADLLLRDGNLPLIVLDLQNAAGAGNAASVPASTWHRFQRLAEPGGTALVILSAQPLVEGAQVRIALRQRWTLAAMRQRRSKLLDEIQRTGFHAAAIFRSCRPQRLQNRGLSHVCGVVSAEVSSAGCLEMAGGIGGAGGGDHDENNVVLECTEAAERNHVARAQQRAGDWRVARSIVLAVARARDGGGGAATAAGDCRIAFAGSRSDVGGLRHGGFARREDHAVE